MRRTKRNICVPLLTGLTLSAGVAFSSSCLAETSVSAFIESEFGYGIDQPSWRKAETIVKLEFEGQLTDEIDFTLIPRVRFDFDNNLSNFNSRPPSYSSWNGPIDNDHHIVAELFEGYLEFEIEDSHWVVGKQQVVWGEADGIKVLDVISPQDLREINLDSFEDSRIPTWMINAEFYLSGFEESSLQFILIPDMTFDLLPGNNTDFQAGALRVDENAGTPPPNAPVTPTPGVGAIEPDRPSGEWEVGVRWNIFIDGWDLSFSYFNHYHDLPVRFLSVDDGTGTVLPAPSYQRNNLYGVTASTAIGDWVVRSELAYESNEYYQSSQLEQRGVHETSELSSVTGFDYHGFNDMYLSYQLFATYLNDYNSDVNRDRFLTRHTFLVRQELWNDVLMLEGFVLFDEQDEDGEIRAGIIYQYDDNLTVWTGLDLFFGKSSGLFGGFKDSDRIIFGFKYGL